MSARPEVSEQLVACVFAHVSDVHLGQDRGDGGTRAAERTRRVLRYLDALPGELDAVLLTGDLAEHGQPPEYAQLVDLLADARQTPLVCPGNHDVRGAYRVGLLGGDAGDASPVNQVHHLPRATFVMCDSSIPGRDDGWLADSTLEWLDQVLTETEPGRPVFVCFHHPPARLHARYVDTIRQFGEERLAAVLARHTSVVALLCGHSHTAAATTFAGLPLLVAPGVVSTIRLPWESEPMLDYVAPPMLALHVLDTSGRLTTHFRVVP